MYAKKVFKKTVFEHFSDLGFMGPHTSFAHCVWVNQGDIEILAKTEATVVHCPSSNLRFFNGSCSRPGDARNGRQCGSGGGFRRDQ